ncbi:MAG: hypothetical protein ACTSW7_02535 [Candidatus Thorarchaeota archaeon]
MEHKDLHAIYPISWIYESPVFRDFMNASLSKGDDHFYIADFASGEYDRVPSYFVRELPRLLKEDIDPSKKICVYCTDLHALRLDSLLGKLEEEDILANVRVVKATLEKMDEEATLRPAMIDFLDGDPETISWLDEFLIGEQRFPPECFDIGILNNDVVGYMHEYYKDYSDARIGLQKVRKLIREKGLLVVTMPCSLYVVDNVAVLEEVGFKYLQGVDVNLSTGEKTFLEKTVLLDQLSNLGHYTFLIFSRT